MPKHEKTFSLEEVADALNVPVLAVPQMIMDGLLQDVGNLKVSDVSLKEAKTLNLERYR